MSLPEPATGKAVVKDTEIGSVFVSNYPPYSAWTDNHVEALREAMERPPEAAADLGLYVHIPFCRKRCKFCYFKVYTGKNSQEVRTYLDGLLKEVDIYAHKPAFRQRALKFVYFGGGTPSYLSAVQLHELVDALREKLDWSELQEFSFECEPGTLTAAKVQALRELGVTRISLGVENFDDEILADNGRAHVSKEIERVIPWIKEAGFPLFNLDLISGMVGETTEKWQATVQRTIEVEPDSVTIYQMELPFNTVYSGAIRDGSSGEHFADWSTKRRWHRYAIEQLAAAGYVRSSAYTMVKANKSQPFVYRDALWHGADMMGTGVASFSHYNGIHYQNLPSWQGYLDSLDQGELPLQRAFATDKETQFRRQFILQLKLGELHMAPFIAQFGENPAQRFHQELSDMQEKGLLTFDEDVVRLTMDGLLRVDTLLPSFYEPQYRGARYT